jgi:hypothetical protein
MVRRQGKSNSLLTNMSDLSVIFRICDLLYQLSQLNMFSMRLTDLYQRLWKKD